MRKLVLALVVLPLLGGAALAKGPGATGGGGHGGGPSQGASGPGNGGVDPADLGPLAQTDWRVQWVLQHQHPSSVAGTATPQGPAS